MGISRPGGEILESNGALDALLLSDGENLTGHNVLEFYADLEERAVLLTELQNKGWVKSRRVTLKNKTGERFVGEITVFPYRRDDEDLVVAIIEDVSEVVERLQKEMDDRQRAQRMRDNLFQTALDPICIANFDGYFTDLSPSWTDVLGWSLEELKSRRWLEFVHPDDVEYTRESATRLIRDGKVLKDFENRYLTKNGEIRWLSWYSYPDMDEKLIYGMARDVTERRRLEETLKESETRYRALFNDSPVSLWEEDFSAVKRKLDEWNGDGTVDIETRLKDRPDLVNELSSLVDVVDVNRATLDLCGARNREELLGNLSSVMTSESLDAFRHEVTLFSRGETVFEHDNVFRTLEGELKEVMVKVAVAPGHEDRLDKVFVTVNDMTERNRLQEELRLMALSDPLTGIGNRRYFLERAAEETRRSERYGDPLTFIILDIDRFKGVNDEYGHDAGDEVLRSVAVVVARTLRETDIIGRIGGEEFAALLIGASPDRSREIAERLRATVSRENVATARGVVSVTVSVGIAIWGTGESLDDLYRRADEALYAAKKAGRDRVETAKGPPETP